MRIPTEPGVLGSKPQPRRMHRTRPEGYERKLVIFSTGPGDDGPRARPQQAHESFESLPRITDAFLEAIGRTVG